MREETNVEYQSIVKLSGLVVLLGYYSNSLLHFVNNTKEISVLVPSYVTVLSKKILPAIELLENAIEDIESIAAVTKAEESEGDIK